jgi:ABC-type transporter Mla MlaB component
MFATLTTTSERLICGFLKPRSTPREGLVKSRNQRDGVCSPRGFVPSCVILDSDVTSDTAIIAAHTAIVRQLARSNDLLIDASQVTNCDTRLIALLVLAKRSALVAHVRIELIPSYRVAQWLALTRLTSLAVAPEPTHY